MEVTEYGSTYEKTKNVLDEMIAQKQTQRETEPIPELDTIFKDLWIKRHGYK